MQPAQPNWNVSKLGNNADQWGVYDDNDNGRHVATVKCAYNARLIAAAPELMALLQEIYDWTAYKNTPWARKTAQLLVDIPGNDDVLHTD